MNYQMEKKEIAGIQVEMSRANCNYLQKNFEDVLTSWKPEDKISFLEHTLFKRKTLTLGTRRSANGIKKANKYQSPLVPRKSRHINNSSHSEPAFKCPVYKCFLELMTEEALVKHYDEAHKDLKELGLELSPPSLISIGQGGEKGNGLKGKI
jgi:hypothetical protein